MDMRDALLARRNALADALENLPEDLASNLRREIDALDAEIELLDNNPGLNIKFGL